MKADKCGTMTEQLRHRINWRKADKRADSPACRNCTFGEQVGRNWRCKDHGMATSPAAVCDDHA